MNTTTVRVRMGEGSRASVIVAVLLLLVIGVIVSAGVLGSAAAAASATQADLKRTQARALAWSGVQAVMAQLALQRNELLQGAQPDVKARWSLYTDVDGTQAVVRLLDVSPADPSTMLASENAKIDLNSATSEMLAALPGIDQSLAEKIVALRDAQPLRSVESLLGVAGVDAQLLYGLPSSIADVASTGGFSSPDGSFLGDAGFGGQAGVDAQTQNNTDMMDQGPMAANALVQLCTVYSFDPNVQLGLDNEGETMGRQRVNLHVPWSDQLGEAIAKRIDQRAADMVKGLMQGKQDFSSDSQLVKLLIGAGVKPEDWSLVFDVFTTRDDMYLPGRVDINRAPVEVLAAVPGIDQEHAAMIVEHRSTMDQADKQSVVWPVVEGILEPEAFIDAVDWLTTRSMQWRVRLEAGFLAGEPGMGSLDGVSAQQDQAGVPMTLDELTASFDEPPEDDQTLDHRIVLEAVIDIASERPRVAYLRDMTVFEPMLALSAALEAQAARQEAFEPGEDALPVPEGLEGLDQGASGFGDGAVALPGSGFDGDRAFGGFDAGAGQGLDAGFGNSLEDDSIGGFGTPGQATTPDAPDDVDDAQGTASGANATKDDNESSPKPGEMVDRRLGRWRAGKAGRQP